MIEKFDRRYRIGSTRLSKWDYEWNASYFITICTEEKIPYFGSVHNQQFIANSIGEIALQRWLEMPSHYPFVELDSFVVMPNHVHGIVKINNGWDKNGDNLQVKDIHPCGNLHQCKDANQRRGANQRRDAINRVSTASTQSSPSSSTTKEHGGGITGHHNPMLHNNLSRVIRWYKGRVTYECRKIGIEFCWQERFHEHIIRNKESYQKIKTYIINNPANWEDDKFNTI